MASIVLLAIDKYQRDRLVCAVEAASLEEAAKKLGGELRDVRRVGQNDPYRLHVDVGNRCGAFDPGPGTHEVLAAAANPGLQDAVRDLEAYYRYGTDNCYRGYVLAETMLVR